MTSRNAADDLAGSFGPEQGDAGEDLGTERVELELERRHHPEAPTSAPQCPEQLGVLALGRADDPTVPGHELGGDEVVAREAVLALEPPGAAAERQAGNPCRRHAAARGGEAVGLGHAIKVSPDGTAADPHDAPVGVDVDVGHATHVEHHAVVAQRQTGDGVAAGPHGDRQLVLACERQGRHDIVDGDALDHEQRSALDHGVEERAGVFVERVAGLVHTALQAEAELVDTRDEAGCGHGTSLMLIRARIFTGTGHPARWPERAIPLEQTQHAWRAPRQPRARARRA